METELIFSFRGVSYVYDENLVALEKVDLDIRRGERVAILGANGCGKSTLLKILDGLYFPTSGQVCYRERPLSEAAFREDEFHFAFRRQVGLVFQDSDIQLFCPSVWEEVAFAPLQLGLSREEVAWRVERALAALRIEPLAGRAPHRLSSGEKKRVALASVLSLNPEVWLLDEPTAGLDPRSQAWLEDFVIEQGELGKTVVTATHDLSIVDSIADRVYVLGEDHRLAAQGAPADILGDEALLKACNLIHDHRHRHGQGEHSHPHIHRMDHDTSSLPGNSPRAGFSQTGFPAHGPR